MKCGKSNCRCHGPGPKHGPFFYLNRCLPKANCNRSCSNPPTRSLRPGRVWPLMRRWCRCLIRSAKSITNCSAAASRWRPPRRERTGSVSGLRHQSLWLVPHGALRALHSPLSHDSDALPFSEPAAGRGHACGQLSGASQADGCPRASPTTTTTDARRSISPTGGRPAVTAFRSGPTSPTATAPSTSCSAPRR